MTDIAIKVENLSKCFQIYDKPHQRLLQGFLGSKKQYYQEFWALNDVSFEIKKGETVGIIGRNGSGKSTLLQIICGTLTPSGGTVETNGRIAALLELGSGFNPEFTGRENVYMNAAVLGLTQEETNQRFDEITAFADIGAFIEQPIKSYSSGMLVRLAFAVQVAVEPDILIVDEALSVGDFFFQQKCFGRLRQMQEQGLTLLFVSHDTGTVRNLCSTAIYLNKGRLKYVGDSVTAIRKYLTEDAPINTPQSVAEDSPIESVQGINDADLAEIQNTALWSAGSEGNNRRLLAVRLLDADGLPTTQAKMTEVVIFQIYFKTPPEETGHISLAIKNRYDQIVTTVGSYGMGLAACNSGSAAFALFEIEIELMLEAGLYSILAAYGQPIGANKGNKIDETDWFGPLQINWNYETETAPFLGMFGLTVKAGVIYGNESSVNVNSAANNFN